MSSVGSGAHPVNSVDVIINGAGARSAQQNLTGNQMAMWGMPRPDQMSMYGMPRADFFSPDFRLPQHLQWMSQLNTAVKPSGNGGYTKQYQKKDNDYRGRRLDRTQSNSGSDKSRNDRSRDNSSRGEFSSRRRRDDVSNRDDSTSRGESSYRGERSDRSTSSRNDSRDSNRQWDRDTSDRTDRRRDRSAQASSLIVDLDEDDRDADDSESSDGSYSN